MFFRKMSLVKNAEEIELIRANSQLVSRTLAEVAKRIAPGVTGLQLDKMAEEFIRDNGATPAFLGYEGYPNALCVSVNEVVIHGIPTDYAFREGDIVSVDCGTRIKGYVGDSAYTFAVGEISDEAKQLMRATKECLRRGVAQAVEGNRVGDISYAVQSYAEGLGYSVVRTMEGHGIGTKVHEKPGIPNYGKRGAGKKLIRGMTLCIEPMINAGKKDVVLERDKWTLRTKDRRLSAHYEYAVAVGKNAPDILTTFDYVEEVLRQKGSFFVE